MVGRWLVRMSLRSAVFAGGIGGFVFGLFAGCILGAMISWFAGAIVQWQAQLGYSLGVTQQLLPLGGQVGYLQTVSDNWYLVIPGAGLLIGAVGALIGMLAVGLWAALVNLGILPIEVRVLAQAQTATTAAEQGPRRPAAAPLAADAGSRRQHD